MASRYGTPPAAQRRWSSCSWPLPSSCPSFSLYTAWVFRVLRGRITLEEIRQARWVLLIGAGQPTHVVLQLDSGLSFALDIRRAERHLVRNWRAGPAATNPTATAMRRLFLHPYPHVYRVSAAGAPAGAVTVSSPQLPDIETAPPSAVRRTRRGLVAGRPAQCGGRRLLHPHIPRRQPRGAHGMGKARAPGGRNAGARGRRVAVHALATLAVPAGTDVAKARALLERAEHSCLVSNSLRGARTLEAEVVEQPR